MEEVGYGKGTNKGHETGTEKQGKVETQGGIQGHRQAE